MLIKQKVLFSEEECNIIINLSKINPQKWDSEDRKYNSETIQFNENSEWLFTRLKCFLEEEVNIKLIKMKNQIHFHKFKNEDWFGKHDDVRDERIYSVGVLLNVNFSGGDLKLFNKNEIITIDKIIGNTYIFDVRIEHQISKILYGERNSLIWFLQNEHIKNKTNKLL